MSTNQPFLPGQLHHPTPCAEAAGSLSLALAHIRGARCSLSLLGSLARYRRSHLARSLGAMARAAATSRLSPGAARFAASHHALVSLSSWGGRRGYRSAHTLVGAQLVSPPHHQPRHSHGHGARLPCRWFPLATSSSAYPLLRKVKLDSRGNQLLGKRMPRAGIATMSARDPLGFLVATRLLTISNRQRCGHPRSRPAGNRPSALNFYHSCFGNHSRSVNVSRSQNG